MSKDSTAARQSAVRIVQTLRAAGHTAYFAGGCVRDELLGLTPTDYDVATDAPPERLAALFPRTSEVGASFGVVLVRDGSVVVEVATFRAEGGYSDKRRPDWVRFSTAPEDARRRDFTVNAIFLDPLAPSLAAGVIDYVGGLDDLKAKVLRAVGDADARLADDHLRALRGVRLSAKLGFVMEEATAAAIRRHASELTGVSRERIGDEVRRIVLHPSRGTAAVLLRGLGLEAPVFTTASGGDGTFPRLRRLGDIGAGVATGLAAWALDMAAAPLRGGEIEAVVKAWRRALVLSNDEAAELRGVLEGLGALRDVWGSWGVAKQKRFAASKWFPGSLALLASEELAAAEVVAGRVEVLRATEAGLSPRPWVDGDELVKLGMRPGPRFKGILDEVYDAQLEGRIKNVDEARELAARRGIEPESADGNRG